MAIAKEGGTAGWMISAITAANRILVLAKDKGWELTPLQLMKLVYMSQGWMLGIMGKKLFDDRIEAWQYGPVIPTLYNQTKKYGASPIKEQLIAPRLETIDEETESLLSAVVKNYGHLSGPALSNLTHGPGSPWSKVWKPGSFHLEIPENIIKEHYECLKNSQYVTSA